MNRNISIALLVLGVVLLIWGFSAYQSIGDEITEAFTGTPRTQTMWLIGGGIVASIVGLLGIIRGK